MLLSLITFVVASFISQPVVNPARQPATGPLAREPASI
jgi:hypothetical protein